MSAALAHHRIAVDMDMFAGAGPNTHDGLDIVLGMDPRQLLHRSDGRRHAREGFEGGVVQRGQHRAQAIGALGVVDAGVVLEERRMTHQQGRHEALLRR
jgi:hypothetical protein